MSAQYHQGGDRPVHVFVHQQAAQSNGLGVAGFVCSLLGLLTCGLLSPIGLLFSFIGLFFPPRGLAVAGFILGALGSMVFVFFGFAMIAGLFVPAAMLSSRHTQLSIQEARVVSLLEDTGREAEIEEGFDRIREGSRAGRLDISDYRAIDERVDDVVEDRTVTDGEIHELLSFLEEILQSETAADR